MLAASASLLNIKVVILDSGEHAPAKQILAPTASHLSHIDGSFTDSEKIGELASRVNVLTVEIEHVDADALQEVQATTNVEIHPSPSTIKIIQDKFRQKEHLSAHGSPVSQFMGVENTRESLLSAGDKLGYPLMLKSRTLAYDGRGNVVVTSASQVEDAIGALRGRPLYAEKWVPFIKEIAVMVVRTTSGHVVSYPVVETVHKNNICHLVFAPLRGKDATVEARAQKVAEEAIRSLPGAGIFGVEMFLMESGTCILDV
jgi:phosphoribosylaminoimidazole carboxylase